MLKKVAILVAGAVLAVLAYAATRPDEFRIERRTVVQAPPEKVFALIDDFHRWGTWSPWEKLDPQLKRTYGGAASGRGAVYEWAGDKNVGRGRMEIVESAPPSKVMIKLDFIEPFEASNVAEFSLTPRDGATEVVWAMSGRNNYFAKLMGVFVDFDSLVGKDFENGLASMKSAAES